MARQRFIWPSFWTDPVTGRLSSDEALFFIGCFSNADDEGRLLGDPAYLGSMLFPYRGLSPTKVKALRDSVARKVPAFTVYEVERTPYIVFEKWSEYQKPKYPSPSKIPPPKKRKRATAKEKSSGNVPGTLGENSGNDEGSLGERLPHGLGLGLGKPPLTPPRGDNGQAHLTNRQLRDFTGCRYARGSHGSSYVRDPLGTAKPPSDWPYPKPEPAEIKRALAAQDSV